MEPEPEPETEPETEPEPETETEPDELGEPELEEQLRSLKVSELLQRVRGLGVPQDMLDEIFDRDVAPAEALIEILLAEAQAGARAEAEADPRSAASLIADLAAPDRLVVSAALSRLDLMFTAAAEDASGERLAERSAEVVAAGGVRPLLQIVQSRIHVKLRRAACLVLGSAAASEALQGVLVEAGAVEVFVSVLQPGRHYEHQQLACSALANMAFFGNAEAERREVARQQRLEAAEIQAERERDLHGAPLSPFGGQQQEEDQAPEAIARLLEAEEGQAARWMTIMLSKGPRRSKQWSAACLCNLAQSRYARTALVEANVVKTAQKVLVKIGPSGAFEASRSEGLQELLLGLLCNLALDDVDQSVRSKIVRAGGMKASLLLLHSSDPAVQEAAAAALGSITTVSEEEEDNGLVSTVRDALRSEQMDVHALDGDEQPASGIQTLAECALESESEAVRETAMSVFDGLGVDVTTAANEKHFTAIINAVADCVDSALAPIAPRTLHITPLTAVGDKKLSSMVMQLPKSDHTFVDITHPVMADLIRRRQAGDPDALAKLPYEADDDLLDGHWHKMPNAQFEEAVEALANQVEHVEPSRQELVSFGVDMGTYLESYFLQVQQEMKEKAGVFSEEEVSEISGRLLERVDGQRERYLTRQREAEEALEALDRVDAQRGRYLETQQKMLAN